MTNAFWSDWIQTTSCGDSCGSCASVTKKRSCLSAEFGIPCIGSDTKFELCNISPCKFPRMSCCGGLKAMSYKGKIVCGPLPPDTDLKIPSTLPFCPVTGGIWSEWNTWSDCSGNCGDCGTASRSRQCLTTTFGCLCTGSDTEVTQCKVKGVWSAWAVQQNCNGTCGGCGTMVYSRTCLSTGCACEGSATLIQPCSFSLCIFPTPSCCSGLNIFYCEATSTSTTSTTSILSTSSSTQSGATSTTLTTPLLSTSTTPQSISSTTRKTFDPSLCNNNTRFYLISASVDPSKLKSGKFGGYFQTRSSCEKLCAENYGLLICNAYMYEPQKSGKCTIFQYFIEDKIIKISNSTASVFKKCNVTTIEVSTSTIPTGSSSTVVSTSTVPTTQTITTTIKTTPSAVTENCCIALVQTQMPTRMLASGIMSFKYNNNTCRTTATITCQQPQGQGLELTTAIVVNQINFIDVAVDTLTLPATCKNGTWQIAEPPLNIMSLQCAMTDPA